MNNINIRALEGVVPLTVKFTKTHPKAQTPTKGSARAVGWDLYAVEDTVFGGMGTTLLIRTGIALELPTGYEAQVRGRSSLNGKGLAVLFGTVEDDYRGEIQVVMTCLDRMAYCTTIREGDRIAQLVIAPVVPANFIEVEELTQTARGTGGFGSSGR